MADLQLSALHETENKLKGINPNAPVQIIKTHNFVYVPEEDLTWIEPNTTPEKRYDELIKKLNNSFHCLTKLTE